MGKITGKSRLNQIAKPSVLEKDHAKTEGIVTESDEFVSCLLLYSPNPVLIFNNDTSIRYVNPLLEKLTGFSSTELIDKKAPHPWWSGETRCQTRRDLMVVMNQGANRVEEIFRKKSGERFCVEITSTPIIINGELKYYLANWVDITHRKEVETSLQESEQKYKVLTESSLTGIFVHTNGKYVFVNDEFARIHGYTPKELVGKAYITLIHPTDREIVQELVKARLENKDVSTRYEVRRLKKDGSVIWCAMTANKIEYESKISIMGNIVDITARKEAEDALRENETKYHAIFKEAIDGISLVDNTGTIIDCNTEFERQTGRKLEELRKIKIWEIASPHNTGEIMQEVFNVEQNMAKHMEILIKKPDGETTFAEYRSSTIKIAQRKYTQFIIRDISNRKQAEQVLKIAGEQYQSLIEYCNQAVVTLDAFQKIIQEMGNQSQKVDIQSPLNARELEIMKLVSRGMSNKDIAIKLAVSDRTISAHLRSIFAKMDVGSRTEAIYKSLRNGWINLS